MMIVFRVVMFLLFGAAVLSFIAYAFTSNKRYLNQGILILKWAVIGGLVFFGVLIAEGLYQASK